MRIGFVSFDRLDYQVSVEAAVELGFDYLELMMDGPTRREALDEEADAMRDRLATHGLDLLVHFPYPLLIGSPHPAQREGAVLELKRCIDVAVELGGTKGVVHPDSYGWSRVWTPDRRAALVAESVAELDEYGRQRDFEICVENLRGGPSLDLQQLDAILEGTEASLTFDTGHAAIAGLSETEMAAFLADHPDRVSHLHLNDNRHSDPGYRGADEHLPLGYGNLDFSTILEPCLDGSWAGTASIELDTADLGYLEASQEHLRSITA